MAKIADSPLIDVDWRGPRCEQITDVEVYDELEWNGDSHEKVYRPHLSRCGGKVEPLWSPSDSFFTQDDLKSPKVRLHHCTKCGSLYAFEEK